MTARVILIDLDHQDIERLNELLGDLPHRHAVGLIYFFNDALLQTQKRAQDMLEEFQRLCAEAEAATSIPTETTVH